MKSLALAVAEKQQQHGGLVTQFGFLGHRLRNIYLMPHVCHMHSMWAVSLICGGCGRVGQLLTAHCRHERRRCTVSDELHSRGVHGNGEDWDSHGNRSKISHGMGIGIKCMAMGVKTWELSPATVNSLLFLHSNLE